MMFLAPALLAGLALASVPIIIHILNRRRFQIIDWPPMKYLKLTLKRNRRRIRIEQMILLAMRTLAVVLLILAIARPVLPQKGLAALLPGRARTSHVVVIDDSLSMGYTAAGHTAFQLAQNAVADLLKSAGAQDSVTLLVTSAPDRPIARDASLQDSAKLVDLVATLPLTDTPSRWSATLDGVIGALSTALYSEKEVVLITDLRRFGWSKDVARPAADLAALRVPVKILDVGDRRTDNVALLRLESQDAILLPDQPIHLSAEIRNQTAAAITGSQATLTVDGDARPVLLPELPSGATTTVPLTLTLTSAGPHTVSFSLSKDNLPQDDTRFLSLDVRPTVSVMLVDGAPSAQKFESETDFLALCYSLGARPWNVDRQTQLEPRRLVVGGPDVPDVLVLANVASLSVEQAGLIERLVQRGMGLVIFCGDQVDVDAYNQRLYRDGHGLLPAKLNRATDTPATGLVVEKDPQSPLAPLAKLLPEALAKIQVRQYMPAQIGSPAPEGVSVLARWNNAENPPAVVQKAFGKGRVLLITSTAGRKWTDWPIDRTYPLAVRSAALGVARGQDIGGVIDAGQAIQIPLDSGQAAINPTIALPAKGATDPVDIEHPSAATTSLRYDKTNHVGVYTLTWRDEKSAARSARFAVNPPAGESDLESISEAQLAEFLTPLKPIVRRYETGGASFSQPPHEIWRPLATMLLGLLGLEAMFAVWVGRER